MLEKVELNEKKGISAKCIVIMPIYNRRDFLKQAFRSLREQTYTQWNLLIVDDGSNDEPLMELKLLAKEIPQRVTYVKQSNGGPGAARATGQRFIQEQEFVAFFDSDDYWLPEYLDRAITQLETIPALDWIFCPCRRVDHSTGRILLESTFSDEENNEPLKFLSLPVTNHAEANVFQNNRALALIQLKQPIHAGFQNSVIRARLAHAIRIPDYRIGEDRYFLMAAILNNYSLGYVKQVGVIYHVHENNLSDTNRGAKDTDKKVAVQKELCRSFADIKVITQDRSIINEAERQSANIKFWLIGYHYYWRQGDIGKGLCAMLEVVLSHPTNFRYLKTLLMSILRAPAFYFKNKLKVEH